jgi:hypothetical protein
MTMQPLVDIDLNAYRGEYVVNRFPSGREDRKQVARWKSELSNSRLV